MSARVLIVVLAALLAAVLLLRDGAAPPASPPPPRARRPAAVRRSPVPPVESMRNVFEYGSRPAPEAPIYEPPPVIALPEEMPPPTVAPAVRLVGLVRRGGVVKAALSVHGETVVVGTGEAAGDYRVVSIDEDAVRLRAADGSMITLVTSGP